MHIIQQLWNIYEEIQKYIYIFSQAWKCEYYNWKVKCIVLNKFNEMVTEKKNYNNSNKKYIYAQDYCELLTVLLYIANTLIR